MTKEQFDQEMNYHVSLIITKQLLSRGIITEEEFKQMDALLLEKYLPIISSL
ncbi:SHOCT domain-containing protein [Acetobacterium carbinolicum]|uniref:SHOCT domain-containing protein n=1 Tax=Acetobacterium carbinolicum TaxID=52690 RepID=UPI0039C99695